MDQLSTRSALTRKDFQRILATNLDPNRDHIKLARQQTIDLKKLFNSFEPHIALDMHEVGHLHEFHEGRANARQYGAPGRYGTGLLQASDALFAAAKVSQSVQ